MGMNENKEEKVAAKFKIGDRVQVTVDQGDLVEKGTKFTVTAVGGTHTFYYEGDPNRAGVWEKNLKLVEAAPIPESVAVGFTAVNVGDRVRLTGNDEVHDFVVAITGDNNWYSYMSSERSESYRSDEGWTVEILERAKPELPTKPGLYVDSLGDPWKLADNGYWYDKGYANNSSNRNMEYIQSRAPFVRLVREV